MFSFRKLCPALRVENFVERNFCCTVGHRLLVRNCDRPQVVFGPTTRAGLCVPMNLWASCFPHQHHGSWTATRRWGDLALLTTGIVWILLSLVRPWSPSSGHGATMGAERWPLVRRSP